MPDNIKITITNSSGKTAFTPDRVNISEGDSVFWVNKDNRGDTDGAHQLGPVGGPADAWMPFPVLPGEGGQSNIVSFPNAGTFPYQCFVSGHQNESGTINVGSSATTVT